MNLKLIRTIVLLVALVVFAGGVGYKLGTSQVKVGFAGYRPKLEVVNKVPQDSKADFSLFWQVWDEISLKYVDKNKLDAQKMVYGAITGMVASVDDPYTVFLPPQENKESKESLNGTFEGIGAQLDIKDKRIIVVEPLPDSPAKKAGLLNVKAESVPMSREKEIVLYMSKRVKPANIINLLEYNFITPPWCNG